MSRTRVQVVAALVALGLVLPTALTSTLPAATAAPAAASTGSAGSPREAGGPLQKAAHSSLLRAQRVLAGDVSGARRGDATMTLRDLALHRDDLGAADREAADALFRRPTDAAGDGNVAYTTREATPLCDADLCIHYVATTGDAPTPIDADANGYPDFVDATLAVMEHVHDTYLAAGYREPEADKTKGGDARIDIYLADIGHQGIYGYCTSDEPQTSANKHRYDRWAYCVLDNDFSAAEFPTNTSLENLAVTAAHEYFHATQFAYDYYEDSWLLEATAAWVEDEVYDNVDDNLQYLRQSQMRLPRTSLDTFNAQGFHYGTWSFFRFLTEKYRTKKGPLPRLVLDIFTKADGAPGGPDQYSWQAVESVLKKKHTSGAAQLAAYAAANRRPGTSYAEGRANHYPTAPLQGSAVLSRRSPRTTVAPVALDHLTTATYRLTPRQTSKKTRLRVSVDMADKVRGSLAIVTVLLSTGRTVVSKVRLDRHGNGAVTVPFGSAGVRYAEVTLVNGSGRFTCFDRGSYSCQGTPLDQHQQEKLSAHLV
ncbi:hypothetical protein BH11ACT8_BH11ACT8_01450 [soil metagenome]